MLCFKNLAVLAAVAFLPSTHAGCLRHSKGGESGHDDLELMAPRDDFHARLLQESQKARQLGAPVSLSQADFAQGTIRITEPGVYRLSEDIEFAPQEANDYWPPFDMWDTYPPSSYYLGFFAAIAIEADDVVIDLDGHTIRQSEEFYLLQRFFNVIELNDRIFVANEGVSSLNYQASDRPAFGAQAGLLVTPKRVTIKNGNIGRSSHAGIHGNSIEGLTIKDVHISDFEVAGIQCNGCKDVSIKQVEVGPGAKDVPVLATFSNARFLEFFTHRLIPHGFAAEPNRMTLENIFLEEITFGDRPDSPVSLQSVFDRNKRALELFREDFFGVNTAYLSPEDQLLLKEAKSVFANPSKLPDGGVQYGILLNRRGTVGQDDNFVGAGIESANVNIQDVQIHGLHANPLEVPSLMTEQGSHMQGVARDLIRIYDLSSDRMRTLIDSRYIGNHLSDVYFALWQMSNTFYRERVFDSDCGNYGSNASMPLNIRGMPSDEEPTCTELGTKADPSLTGRQVTMLQKQYFGGLQISQGLYDWATTPLKGLDSVLFKSPRADLNRNGGLLHIVCDHDTMFHPNHGVVGLKMVEVDGAVVKDVEIFDLVNQADDQLWVCKQKWQLQPSEQDISAVTAALDSFQGSMVRGIEVVRSNDISFIRAEIHNLSSDEGLAVGVEIKGDGNDRTDHDDDDGVSFQTSSISRLTGARGAMAFKSSATPLSAVSGLTVGTPDETDSSLGNPRFILNYQMTNARSPRAPGDVLPSLTFVNDQVLIDLLRTTTLDTPEKVITYRRRVLAFYTEHYGMKFASDVHDIEDGFATKVLEPITVLDRDGNPTDSVVQLGQLSHDTEYHATSMCINFDHSDGEGECTDTATGLVHDFAFNFFPGPSGYTFHGAFGGDEGQYCPQNHIIWVGLYSFERVVFPGVNEGANLQVEYYGECPTPVERNFDDTVTFYINCAVESDQFGKGLATGAYIFYPTADGKEWTLNGYPSMVFDDQVPNPVKSTVETFYFDPEIPHIDTNVWRFSFIADGFIPTLLAGVGALPFGAHHYTHEAGIMYLKGRTSINTDAKILELRKKFLARLRDSFGIDVDPEAFDDAPLDGVVDLGGGNHIMAYVVNEDANQRVMTKRGHDGGKVVAMPRASRLHEGGFRFVVGRAGIATSDVTPLPFGTTFLEGVYILEDSAASDLEIEFSPALPILLNPWVASVIYQNLYHPVLGQGRAYSFSNALEVREADGITLGNRGVFVFGNMDECEHPGTVCWDDQA